MPDCEVWDFYSAHVDAHFRISIAPPSPPTDQASPAGMVLALDGDWLIGSLAGITRSCVLSGELPPLYAVGIGYPVGARPAPSLQRLRDLTPSAQPDCDAFTAAVYNSELIVKSGGANAFLAFLAGELIPAIASAFPIERTCMTLVGSSLGGLCALHAWLNRKTPIQNFLAISPALWWEYGLLCRQLRERLAHGEAPPGRLFLAAGTLESEQINALRFSAPKTERPPMPDAMARAQPIADVRAFAAELRNAVSDFPVTVRILEAEGHNSVFGAALSHGLRALIGASRRDAVKATT